MSLQDLTIRSEYRSLVDQVVLDFYVPLLKEAILYQRAVGYFSSSALNDISKGIAVLEHNGGKIQLIASPRLTQDDVDAIKQGYENRDRIIENALYRDLEAAKTPIEKKRLNYLSHLIANRTLDIKIALLVNHSNIGMYHEKVGIISDSLGNKVAFSGSMNETKTGFSTNYEAIDVFCSWTSEDYRVTNKEAAFVRIWNNCEKSIDTIEFPNLKQEILDRYMLTSVDEDFENEDFEDIKNSAIQTTSSADADKPIGARVPSNITFYDFQIEAIDDWVKANYCGIFDMATGTGKTYTGLGAVARLCSKTNGNIGVIVVCPFQHLVEQWVEDIKIFGMDPIIGYSKSSQTNWIDLLEDAIRDQKLKVPGKQFFCFVCTNATFSSVAVQKLLNKVKGEMLLVVDEAHNFGAIHLVDLLTDRYKYRLALSATLERHNDEEGTSKLLSYFGEKCIEYTLERAISEKKLTPYKYYPIVVYLSEDELSRYEQLSFEIAHNVITTKTGKTKLSKYGEILALRRARIIAGATEKVNCLRKEILPYKDSNHILVYCGATKIVNEEYDFIDIEDDSLDDIRQIDVITQMLGNEMNMKVSQFTSKEDVQERSLLKEQFKIGTNLQALIAIKCLDEGVNIPAIKTAFILASTTNPKEYIQRRGRVLRLAEGKEFAEIYDFVTLPRHLDEVSTLTTEQAKRDLSLVNNEIKRMEEFSQISMNQMQSQSVIWKIKEAYRLYGI